MNTKHQRLVKVRFADKRSNKKEDRKKKQDNRIMKKKSEWTGFKDLKLPVRTTFKALTLERYVNNHLTDSGVKTIVGKYEEQKKNEHKKKIFDRLKIASTLLITDQFYTNYSATDRIGFRIFLNEFSNGTLKLGTNPLDDHSFRYVTYIST